MRTLVILSFLLFPFSEVFAEDKTIGFLMGAAGITAFPKEFKEPNADLKRFSDQTDPIIVGKEQEGQGWRYFENLADDKNRNNVLIYHGGRGFTQEGYFIMTKRGRDLNKIGRWFSNNNVNFYSPLRKTDLFVFSKVTDFKKGFKRSKYSAAYEPLEIQYHMFKHVKEKYGENANYCIVGHSEGGSAAAWLSVVLHEKNIKFVSISPANSDYGGFMHYINFLKDKYISKSKNLTIYYGYKETLKSYKKYTGRWGRKRWEWYSDLFATLPKYPNIKWEVIMKEAKNSKHQHIAKSKKKFLKYWGKKALEGCGFH